MLNCLYNLAGFRLPQPFPMRETIDHLLIKRSSYSQSHSSGSGGYGGGENQ